MCGILCSQVMATFACYSSLLCFLMCTSDSDGFFQSQLVVDSIAIKAIVHNMHGVCIPQHSSIACSNTHLYSIAIRITNYAGAHNSYCQMP